MKHRDASVQVRDTWDVVEELDFPRMSKLTLPDIGEGEDLYVYQMLLQESVKFLSQAVKLVFSMQIVSAQ